MKKLVVVLFLTAAMFSQSVLADEWGCKLLLCLSNPAGWGSVPDCHPPVEKYLACAHLLFGACGFPTCPEGGGSGLSYQKFDDCPTGYTPAASDNSGGKGFGVSEQSICRSLQPTSCDSGTRDNTCTYSEIERPLKQMPYSINVTEKSTGEVKTYYFNF